MNTGHKLSDYMKPRKKRKMTTWKNYVIKSRPKVETDYYAVISKGSLKDRMGR